MTLNVCLMSSSQTGIKQSVHSLPLPPVLPFCPLCPVLPRTPLSPFGPLRQNKVQVSVAIL